MKRCVFAILGLVAGFAGCDSTLSFHTPWEGNLAPYEEGCDRGNAAACLNLAIGYDGGSSETVKNPVKAAGFYRKACEAGSARGCAGFGTMAERGEGIPKDEALAATAYLRGCDGGDGRACHNAGRSLALGRGVAKDAERAARLAAKACDLQQAADCEWIGERAASPTSGTPDLARAASLFQKACELESAIGCQRIGAMTAEGRGVAKDDSAAQSYFRRALPSLEQGCTSGTLAMCVLLGTMLEHGQGRMADPVKALGLYQKACDGSLAGGCAAAAALAEGLRGPEAGIPFFEKACDGGIGIACRKLAEHVERGLGVASDPGRATTLFAKACSAGDTASCRAPAGSSPAPTDKPPASTDPR